MQLIACLEAFDILKILATGVVAALLTQWLIKGRDRATRKKYFLASIDEWRRYFAKHLDVRGKSADHYVEGSGLFVGKR